MRLGGVHGHRGAPTEEAEVGCAALLDAWVVCGRRRQEDPEPQENAEPPCPMPGGAEPQEDTAPPCSMPGSSAEGAPQEDAEPPCSMLGSSADAVAELTLEEAAIELKKYTSCESGDITICSDAHGLRLCVSDPAFRGGADSPWLDFVRKFALEEKATQPAVFKKLNFIEFQTDCATDAFWRLFADSVRFDSTHRRDGINVIKLEPGRFIVAYHKDDQRKVTLPDGLSLIHI